MTTIDPTTLRPFDARTAKPGDAVVLYADGAKKPKHGRFIAYVEDADEAHQALIKWNHIVHCESYTTDGRMFPNSSVVVFLPPLDPLDEIDPSPCNLANLTRRQVGKGYRIVEHSEKPDERAEWWAPGWAMRALHTISPYSDEVTYRVPIDPSAPRMVPLEQSDIVLGKTVVRMIDCPARPFLVCATNNRGVFIIGYEIVVEWHNLQNDWEISFDHGDTWQKPEKPEGGSK